MRTVDTLPSESNARIISSIINLVCPQCGGRMLNVKEDVAETGLQNGSGPTSAIRSKRCGCEMNHLIAPERRRGNRSGYATRPLLTLTTAMSKSRKAETLGSIASAEGSELSLLP
jgi:hypothetical protein